MKISGIPTLIAIFMGAIISYGFYALFGTNDNQNYRLIHACLSFLILGSTLVSCFGMVHPSERTNTLLKTIGLTFFIILFILFILLLVFTSSIPTLVTLSTFLYLIYLLSMYKIFTANQ
jgi:hypothetical protein